ncbi:hypothetical protein ABB37_06680 [Leptomonas pyrrhocoris]|uniref:EF-hand domain-containing protein n=1 Tax=Leptomonas pyrrhocoris TaxID=157538 RepID=A0A0N0DTS3_LEPPY|nr:hypothetical protein ABB37_06680 [Leptomonas pyrrhocoris]KPA77891.1 hypothetical protein ABB37_06680 [Leptomonas pyrrhocoris]|eukprot:XP_015656330.1 hypothetical protein ABB37_06680 [Leptomonas pyrrhocoris]
MFVLRIAGDVLGLKRNVEVTFPRRPSLQQICTVAETILPLQGRHDRRPWHPPGPLDGSTTGNFSLPSVDLQRLRHHTSSVGDYIVESIAFINPATRQWEEVYSASQLTPGAQVYCFCPLQHHHVAVVQPKESASPSVRHGTHSSITFSLRETLPVVTGVRDKWVNADRPGAIPEPQERLVWDCTATTPLNSAAAQKTPRRGSGVRADQSFSACVSPSNSRNLSRVLDDDTAATAAAAFSPHRVPLASRCYTSNSPSAIQPSYLLRRESAEPRLSGRICRRSDLNSSGPMDNRRLNSENSRLSLIRNFQSKRDNSPLTYFSDPYSFNRSNSPVTSLRRNRQRSLETSAEFGDRNSYKHVRSASSALLLSGNGENRYARLGERLSLLFDVLVHLDKQEAGSERHYLLLRDFYLLSSYVSSCSSTGTAGRESGSAVPPCPMSLTAELASQFGLSWDDVLRSADQDRDGCIAYREWIAYGIEHPDVIQLLCQGVCRLPLHVNEALKRLRLQSESRHANQSTSPLPSPSDHDFQGGKVKSKQSSPPCGGASYPCRLHSVRSSERVHRLAAAGAEAQHTCVVFGGRCEACRELAAQSAEERLLWAAQRTPFVNTLRQ